MTLRQILIRCASDVCINEPTKEAQKVLDEIISFCSIWGDAIDANLEDLEIRRVPDHDPDLPF